MNPEATSSNTPRRQPTKKPRKKQSTSARPHHHGELVVFGFEIRKEDFECISEDDRQQCNESPKNVDVGFRAFWLKVQLQSSGLWSQARTGLSRSRNDTLCTLLILAVRGCGPMPSAEVTARIKEKINISREPRWYYAVTMGKY